MKGRKLVTLTLIVVMLLMCILPALGVQAATSEGITLNSNLYNAVKSSLEKQGISATYNDAQNTIIISEENLNSVTRLELSNAAIKDLTGLDNFKAVTSIDLSANELTSESNLGVLSSLNLKTLDLSSNKISDVSSITNISSVETVLLHNQEFDYTVIIDNSMVKQGTYTYTCELPQIITQFATSSKLYKWVNPQIVDSSSNDFRFTTNGAVGNLQLVIGDNKGNQFTGLATATFEFNSDSQTETLYNTRINLHYVVINSDQRGIEIKDRNLYNAIKKQLIKNQKVNEELMQYTNKNNLYDKAYDEQMIFVINENDLINKIQILLLSQEKISNLTGLDKFIGLKTTLDLSSNYIDTIDKLVDLQNNKDTEEAALQQRFKTKIAEIKEKVEVVEKLETELENAIKTYNAAVKEYNALVNSKEEGKAEKQTKLLETLKTNALKYQELSGDSVFTKGSSTPIADIENYFSNVKDNELENIQDIKYPNGGSIGKALSKVNKKLDDLYNIYNGCYKVDAIITPELFKMSDEELSSLTLENAKRIYSEQVNRVKSIEKYLTKEEQNIFKYYTTNLLDFDNKEKSPLAEYYDSVTELLADEEDVSLYISELEKFVEINANIVASEKCLVFSSYTNGTLECVAEYEANKDREEDEEDKISTEYIDKKHKTTGNKKCTYTKDGITTEDIMAYAHRLTVATDADISTYVVLPRLHTLNVTENLIQNIDEIAILKELRKLYMADNEIVNIKDVKWSDFEKLKVLDLSLNSISEIKSLEVLSKAEEIDVSKNLISGKLDLDISNLKALKSINLSQNQIDDIADFIAQFNWLAKLNYNMTGAEYLMSPLSPKINLQSQDLKMTISATQSDKKLYVELPEIFRQLEELQSDKTSFGINSYYGNVTSDGKNVILDVSNVGVKTALVTVIPASKSVTAGSVAKASGSLATTDDDELGIGIGTKCFITCNVIEAPKAEDEDKKEEEPKTEDEDKKEEEPKTEDEDKKEEEPKTEDEDKKEESKTEDEDKKEEEPKTEDENKKIIMSVSSKVTVENKNNKNYLVVSPKTTVGNLLENLSLNTTDSKYSIVIKDSQASTNLNDTETLKTNSIVTVDGVENGTDCIVVVKGDITGDGQIGLSDMLKLNQYRLNQISEMTDAELLAGNVDDSDTNITVKDILKLNQYRLGKRNTL